MMRVSLYTEVLMSLLMISGCDSYRLKRDIVAFQKIRFELPTDSLIPEHRLVVFYAPEACNSCGYNNLYLWEEMMEYAAIHPEKLRNYFIFSPSGRSLEEMVELTSNGRYDVWLDSAGQFLKDNPEYAGNRRFSTFLLDSSGKAVLMGNPLFNETLYQLYRRTIGMEEVSDAGMTDAVHLAEDPSLVFDRRIYDLGVLSLGAVTEIELVAENTVREDIVITEASSTCPCVDIGNALMKRIPAGKSAVLDLSFSATYAGDFFYVLSFTNSYTGQVTEVALQGSVRDEDL